MLIEKDLEVERAKKEMFALRSQGIAFGNQSQSNDKSFEIKKLL